MTSLNLIVQLEAVIILAAISIASLRFRILDSRGVIASIFIGYITIVFAGLSYFAALLTFFLVSAAATRFRVKVVREEIVEKNWIRSWRNVLANGLAPTFVIIFSRIPGSMDGSLMAAGYLGAIGTAFADTLATEVGLLYRGKPRLITNLRRVEKGTPGAVSIYGYLGGLIALIILATLAWAIGIAPLSLAILLIPSGIIGMTLDSVLGAGVQAKYECEVCGRIVENSYHCNQPARKVSGAAWINTHTVNLISTSIGAVLLTAFTFYLV